MTAEPKQCLNCLQPFQITQQDETFYGRLKVPSPTRCPDCRAQRRMAFRNERSLYVRPCDLCKKQVISMYSPDKPLTVYCTACYWSDQWDPYSFGREYDFNKPFFIQFKELQKVVPRVSLVQENAVNSEWINYERNAKNCYLDVGGEETENCLYCTYALKSQECADSYWIFQGQNCYQSLKSGNCFRAFFSFWCFNCSDTWFSYDCSGCNNIIGCIGLRNKNYHIYNQAVSAQEFDKFVAENLSGSYSRLEAVRKKAQEQHLKFPRRSNYIVKSQDCSGNYIENCKNTKNGWHINGLEDSRNIFIAAFSKGSYDVSCAVNNESVYEVLSCGEGNNIRFGAITWRGVYDLEYCDHIFGGNNCFGSIGLKQGQHAILNKKYPPEAYASLRARVVEHMDAMPYTDAQGRVYKYGDYFPPFVIPFGYNETVAFENFPLSREAAVDLGYHWSGAEHSGRAKPTVSATDLADNIRQATDDAVKQIIACAHQGQGLGQGPGLGLGQGQGQVAGCQHSCTAVYKIIEQELNFYRRLGLPLPRLCPNCRHGERLAQLGPMRRWPRKCQCGGEASVNNQYHNQGQHSHGSAECPNKFDTPFAPERKEIVYCEQCYQSELA